MTLWHRLPLNTCVFVQRIEMHREGVNWQPPKGKQLDLEQRVYVRVDTAHFLGFSQDELAV